MTDLTFVFELIIALIGALLAAFVIPWLRSKMTAEETAEMLAWVRIAVSAAQQLYHNLDGDTRLDYALSVLREKGYDVDSEIVLSAVEAEVLRLHQQLQVDDVALQEAVE